jgi:LysM repeat protein
VTDDAPKKRTRRPRPVKPAAATPAATPSGAPEDPDAALRRLESMGTPAAAGPPADPGPLPPTPAVDSFGPPPPRQRPMGSSRKMSKAPRPRPAGSHTSRMVARIAVPVVFLVAVIALVGIVVNSGVMSGSDSAPTPTPAASSSKAHTTKKYVIRSGDSLSSIAARFNTSAAELMQLNPDLDSTTTLVVGTRLVVPRQ